MRHIRELGSLPSDAFIKYNGLPQSQVRVIRSNCYSSN